jgi:hypothetical protein
MSTHPPFTSHFTPLPLQFTHENPKPVIIGFFHSGDEELKKDEDTRMLAFCMQAKANREVNFAIGGVALGEAFGAAAGTLVLLGATDNYRSLGSSISLEDGVRSVVRIPEALKLKGGVPEAIKVLVKAGAYTCRYLDDGDLLGAILDDPRPTMFGFFESTDNRTAEEEAQNQRFCALTGHTPDMNIVLGSNKIASLFAAPVPSVALLYAPNDLNKVGQTLPTDIGTRGVLRINGESSLNITFIAQEVTKMRNICGRVTSVEEVNGFFKQDEVVVVLHIDPAHEQAEAHTKIYCTLTSRFPAAKLVVSNDEQFDRVLGVTEVLYM